MELEPISREMGVILRPSKANWRSSTGSGSGIALAINRVNFGAASKEGGSAKVIEALEPTMAPKEEQARDTPANIGDGAMNDRPVRGHRDSRGPGSAGREGERGFALGFRGAWGSIFGIQDLSQVG